MRIDNENRFLLFELLFKPSEKNKGKGIDLSKIGKRDQVEISNAANEQLKIDEQLKTNKTTGTSRNRKIDQSIDLQPYVDQAKEANKLAVLNAGNEIKYNYVCQDVHHAFKNALIEKYGKLAEEAKTHNDPMYYIEQKYFDSGSSWYAADLTDQERRIGYVYEKDMLKKGKIMGVSYLDSLFRGIEVDGDVVDAARTAFDRQMVNAQIGNILKNNGIELPKESKCTYSVDPYSYRISVNGVDEVMKQRMEAALNVGKNGMNLYSHIRHCASQEGVNSKQVSKDGILKYRAYQAVIDYTGLELNTLKEESGTYYTKEGKDICDIADTAIDHAKEIPYNYKRSMKDWFRELIANISCKGWNRVKDLVLEIDYSDGKLIDKYQDMCYTADDSRLNKILNSRNYITVSL